MAVVVTLIKYLWQNLGDLFSFRKCRCIYTENSLSKWRQFIYKYRTPDPEVADSFFANTGKEAITLSSSVLNQRCKNLIIDVKKSKLH